MGIYKVKKNGLVQTRIAQPHYVDYFGDALPVPVADFTDLTFCRDDLIGTLLGNFKVIDGRDISLFFNRRNELKEVLNKLSGLDDNYYVSFLKSRYESLFNPTLSKVDILINVSVNRRCKIFKKFSRLIHEVDL